MKRVDIINRIGKQYLTSNIENDEFSYPKELKREGKTINEDLVSYGGRIFKTLDIRFVKNNISILVETKNDFEKWNSEEVIKQLQAYVEYEKVLTNNKIVAILAETDGEKVKVYWGGVIN